MAWITPIVTLVLLAVIAWAAWEAVACLRHMIAQQAATVRLLAKVEERLGTPEDYGAAHWRELDRAQVRMAAEEERRFRASVSDSAYGRQETR